MSGGGASTPHGSLSETAAPTAQEVLRACVPACVPGEGAGRWPVAPISCCAQSAGALLQNPRLRATSLRSRWRPCRPVPRWCRPEALLSANVPGPSPRPPPRPCGGNKRLPLKNDAAWRGDTALTLSWAQLFAAWEGPLAPSSSFVPGYDLMLTSRFLDHPGLGALLQEALEMFLALDAAMGKGGQGHRRWSAGPRKEHAPRVTAAWIQARLAAPLTC